MKMVIKALIASTLLCSAASSSAGAIDDYKFFGSMAALSEMCLKSTKISDRINKVVPAAVKKNPEITDMMKSLIEAYNEAYKKAILDGQIWEATSDGNFRFSNTINCRNAEQAEKIKFLHDYILKNLK